MKWTTAQLIAAGAMGALLAMAALSEAVVNVITGIPAAGGVVGAFFEVTVFAAAVLLIPRFGAGAIVGGVGTALLLPLPVFGPPGFLPKVAIGFAAGFLYDLLFLFFRRFGKWGLALTISVIILLADAAFSIVLAFFNITALKMSSAAFVIFNAVFIVEGVAGSLVAWHVVQKLKNTAVVKRIQGA